MKEIFQEYGPAIITFVVVLLIVAIMYTLTNGQDSVVGTQFTQMIQDFFSSAKSVTDMAVPGTTK